MLRMARPLTRRPSNSRATVLIQFAAAGRSPPRLTSGRSARLCCSCSPASRRSRPGISTRLCGRWSVSSTRCLATCRVRRPSWSRACCSSRRATDSRWKSWWPMIGCATPVSRRSRSPPAPPSARLATTMARRGRGRFSIATARSCGGSASGCSTSCSARCCWPESCDRRHSAESLPAPLLHVRCYQYGEKSPRPSICDL
mmetsp:Transcript_22066/g.71047  ORF Transcript_22066/g.71047 Transcript_22066/m.71047 type:complete len:200 (+) Transcript_22066:658-1257(+)